mmetsp:Transcript_11381/g.24121  ORF Transcript_11381/g.24121 Transcript_11381/m.24121 type:complete len:284 (-) Transcript_11381:251-1102(-)
MASFVEYNPTMATASMTMASHSVDFNSSVTTSTSHYIESREEAIKRLKSNLSRYSRSNDRRMVLRSLKDVNFLSYIPLEAPVYQNDVPMSDLEKEVSRERVILNDTLLKPRNYSETRILATAATNSGCIFMLKALSQVLCGNSSLNKNSLYERVLFRLAKSLSSADVYFKLNSMMGSTDMIVKELPSDYSVRTTEYGVKPTNANMNKIETNKNSIDDSDLKLYNTGGQIHMILETSFNFGLYRKTDVVVNRPWIVMKCKVYERANLSTNESFRSLNVRTPNLY